MEHKIGVAYITDGYKINKINLNFILKIIYISQERAAAVLCYCYGQLLAKGN